MRNDKDLPRLRQLVVSMNETEWQWLFHSGINTEAEKINRATAVLQSGIDTERIVRAREMHAMHVPGQEKYESVNPLRIERDCNVKWVVYVEGANGIFGHLLADGDYVKWGDETVCIVNGDPEADVGVTLISYPREFVLGVENHQALVHGVIPV